jgi:hypothetical protein
MAVPEAVKLRLLEFLPKSDARISTTPQPGELEPDSKYHLTPDETRTVVWTYIHEAARLANGMRVGECTGAVNPWPHQSRTFWRFMSHWPCRLLIADEVGLGKTISAGLILRQAWLSGQARRVLLLAPKGDRTPILTNARDWDLILLDEAHHARRRSAGMQRDERPTRCSS